VTVENCCVLTSCYVLSCVSTMVVQPQNVKVHGTSLQLRNIDFQIILCHQNGLCRLIIPVHFVQCHICWRYLIVYQTLPEFHLSYVHLLQWSAGCVWAFPVPWFSALLIAGSGRHQFCLSCQLLWECRSLSAWTAVCTDETSRSSPTVSFVWRTVTVMTSLEASCYASSKLRNGVPWCVINYVNFAMSKFRENHIVFIVCIQIMEDQVFILILVNMAQSDQFYVLNNPARLGPILCTHCLWYFQGT